MIYKTIDITVWFPLIKCIVRMPSVDSYIQYRPSNTSSRNRAPEISPDYRSGCCRLLQAGLRWAVASWRHPRPRPSCQGDGGAILASESASASASYLYGEAIEPSGSTSPPSRRQARAGGEGTAGGEFHSRVGVGFPRGSSSERRGEPSGAYSQRGGPAHLGDGPNIVALCRSSSLDGFIKLTGCSLQAWCLFSFSPTFSFLFLTFHFFDVQSNVLKTRSRFGSTKYRPIAIRCVRLAYQPTN